MSLSARAVAIGLAAMLVACKSEPAQVATDAVIETVTSASPFPVNAHIVTGPEGVVVIDSLRTADAAEVVIARLRALNRPVAGILITHTHPDHIGGLRVLKAAYPDAMVYASLRTRDDIASDRGGGIAAAARMVPGFGPTVPTPDQIVTPGVAFSVGGLTFEAFDIGTGEAEHMTLYALPASNVIFGGDVAGRDAHPWLVEGKSGPWLERIAEVKARYASTMTLYPGHGPTAPLGELLDEQVAYLMALRGEIASRIEDGVLSPVERDQVVAGIDRRFPYPDVVAPLPDLKARNVEAVAAEMLADRQGN